jgi:3-oxoacyl-[acyl-carrier-protein] synthase I
MNRVVITGLGVVAPNGADIPDFLSALIAGKSGIKFNHEMQELKLGCNVAGVPEFDESILANYLPENKLKGLQSSNIKYAIAAAAEAWLDAGLTIGSQETDYDTGCIIGSGSPDITTLRWGIKLADVFESRKLGSAFVEQIMASGPSAYIGGIFGLGNQVSAVSSACSTGTESILTAYQKIKLGDAKRMIAGSCDPSSAYTWGAFDAIRVITRKHNDNPTAASRPMSATASGFVPGSGAGILILEDLETATRRGAKIYAEILGGAVNSGGQREGGTMTAPNSKGVLRCFEKAIASSGINTKDVDLVCGHLTSTFADKVEIKNWADALQRYGSDFPHVNSLKSMTGHCLGATGSIECVAAILQLHHNFVHPNLNCEDLHPEITAVIDAGCIPTKKIDKEIKLVMKANFGFGDVNSCIVFSTMV